jgi:hypothetical protein
MANLRTKMDLGPKLDPSTFRNHWKAS